MDQRVAGGGALGAELGGGRRAARAQRSSPASGTRRRRRWPTSSTSITTGCGRLTRCAPTSSSRSADSRGQSLDGEDARRVVARCEETLWTPPDCARLRLTTRATSGTTAATCASAMAPIIRGRSGRGSPAPSSRGGCACTATPTRPGARRIAASSPRYGALRRRGPGQLSEIADADAPFAPTGCPFQAWSVGEALRLTETVLAVDREPAPERARPTQRRRGGHAVKRNRRSPMSATPRQLHLAEYAIEGGALGSFILSACLLASAKLLAARFECLSAGRAQSPCRATASARTSRTTRASSSRARHRACRSRQSCCGRGRGRSSGAASPRRPSSSRSR